MARTGLFRILRRSLRLQAAAARQGTSAESLLERIEEARFSRRQFLGTSLAAAGLLATPPLLRSAWAEAKAAQDPVVILGAGFAGLTAAYRLSKAGVPFILYESSGRLGGRVFTQERFNPDGMFCELGAELIDDAHESLLGLASELGLAVEEFAEGDQGVDKAVYEYEGRLYSEKDMIREVKPLAKRVLADIAEAFPGGERQSVTYASFHNAKKFDLLSLEQYLDGIKDLPRWVRETVRFAFVGEYGLEADRQSALNLLLLIGTDFDNKFDIFGEGSETKRLKGGNSRLTDALAERIGVKSGRDGGRIRFRHELVGWKAGAGKQTLVFRVPGKSSSKEVKAGQVICTIPFIRLREVDGIRALGFSERKLRAILQHPYGTASKLMVGFGARPWRSSGAKAAASNGSLFSEKFQSIWETSRLQAGKSGILTNYVAGNMGLRLSKKDVAMIVGSVERFYPGARALFDGRSALMNWNRSPHHKASFACPGPGHYTEFFGAMAEPELGGRVQFAGEHVSVEYQAFMNGAVETGEAAAAAVLEARGKGSSLFRTERHLQRA